MKLGIHYHIRWSSESPLDWKPFPTEEDALKAAGQLKRANEICVIEKRGNECERCKAFRSQGNANHSV